MEQIGSPAADLDSLKEFGSAPARKVGEAKALFARIDEAKMMERINKEIVEPQIAAAKAEAAKNAPAEKKETPEGIAQIGIEDFSKVELRVAEVLSCREDEKSKKLLKLILNDGDGERQVLSRHLPVVRPRRSDWQKDRPGLQPEARQALRRSKQRHDPCRRLLRGRCEGALRGSFCPRRQPDPLR